MASTDDIYKILLDVKGQLGQHSERFDAIDDKLDPIVNKVDLHDRAIIAVTAAGGKASAGGSGVVIIRYLI